MCMCVHIPHNSLYVYSSCSAELMDGNVQLYYSSYFSVNIWKYTCMFLIFESSCTSGSAEPVVPLGRRVLPLGPSPRKISQVFG
mmetsp:Transcript_40975/g.109586  ORF Transcript_40975/g.109586 Transcript_40975/m.109586 type:complete len:84 (+) Transcript_40975:319-570(+)